MKTSPRMNRGAAVLGRARGRRKPQQLDLFDQCKTVLHSQVSTVDTLHVTESVTSQVRKFRTSTVNVDTRRKLTRPPDDPAWVFAFQPPTVAEWRQYLAESEVQP